MGYVGRLERLTERAMEKFYGETATFNDVVKALDNIGEKDWEAIGEIIENAVRNHFEVSSEEKRSLVRRRIVEYLEVKYEEMESNDFLNSDFDFGVEWYLGLENLFNGAYNGDIHKYTEDLKWLIRNDEHYGDYDFYNERGEGTYDFKDIVDCDTFVDFLAREFDINLIINTIEKDNPTWFYECRTARNECNYFDYYCLDEIIESMTNDLLWN